MELPNGRFWSKTERGFAKSKDRADSRSLAYVMPRPLRRRDAKVFERRPSAADHKGSASSISVHETANGTRII
jgi:hypothetical protein